MGYKRVLAKVNSLTNINYITHVTRVAVIAINEESMLLNPLALKLQTKIRTMSSTDSNTLYL